MKGAKVIVVGQIWRSSQNGMVYDTGGVSPCICVGHHAGVEPKILEYEDIRKHTSHPQTDGVELQAEQEWVVE